MLMSRLSLLATLLAVAGVIALCSGCANNNIQNSAPRQEGTVGARHVLIQYKGALRAPAKVTRTQEEAKAEIEKVLELVKQGEKFEDLAMQYSDCPSASKGGDLGTFGRGRMDAAFEEGAFGCEIGGTTGIVETAFGYHIIQRYE